MGKDELAVFDLAPMDRSVFDASLKNANSPLAPEAEIAGVRVWIGDQPVAVPAADSKAPDELPPTREVVKVTWGLNILRPAHGPTLDRLVVEIRLETPGAACRVHENLPRQEFISGGRLNWSGEVTLGRKDMATAKLNVQPHDEPIMTPRVTASSPMCSLSLWTFHATPTHPLDGGVELVQFVEVPRGARFLNGTVYVEGASYGLFGALAPFLAKQGSGGVRMRVPVERGEGRSGRRL